MKSRSDRIKLDAHLALDAARVSEAAALAASAFIGRGDEMEADRAAAQAMRDVLNGLEIDGMIVIGEGEKDEGALLYIGEKVGSGRGPRLDVALDPLEGTTLAAKAVANALTVVAFAPAGGLFKAPDVYMDKIAIGPGYPQGLVDLDASPADNVRAIAKAKGVEPSEIRVCVLDRPRHADIIASLRSVGARVMLIPDGDVTGVINTIDPALHADLYLGQGGAPEGVLACVALKCGGGQFQGRLVFRNEDEKARARRHGIADAAFTRKYAPGEAIFAATGVTKGALLDGVRLERGAVVTHTVVMTSLDQTVRVIRTHRPPLHG
jgi:fructose-1,6-bisphosphatase II / sedoheptulose-1,7-bisphosphatase